MKWIYIVPCKPKDDKIWFINADSIKSIRLIDFVLFLGTSQIRLPAGTKREDARHFLYTLGNCLSHWQDGHVLTLGMDSLSCVFERADKAEAGGKN